jgi:hypothetical protein
MKSIQSLLVLLFFTLASCSSVTVNADYDKTVDFTKYKTFAYMKEGINKLEISDLDKRRILRAVDEQMLAKGFVKSDKPDFLVNIFTKSYEEVSVYSGWGYGWGYGYYPYYGYGGYPYVSSSTQGMLYIDFIDAKKNELFWQGVGSGYLTQDVDKKEQRINEFATQILAQYPPVIAQNKEKSEKKN